MRSLFLPQVSTTELANESDVSTHRAVMAALDAIEPGRYWFWARQGDEDAQVADADMLYEDPKTQRSFYALMATADLTRMVDLFSWQIGAYPIDAVWTSRVGIAPVIGMALSCGNGLYDMPVVLTEPRVYGPRDLTPHNAITPAQQAIRAAGYASCYGMYLSTWEKQQALELAETYVRPAVLEQWERRAFVCDFPIGLPGTLPSVAERPEKPKRLLFAGRMNSNKQWQKVMEMFASVYQSRDDTEVWLHAGTGAFSKLDPSDHRWHVTSERLPRDEYWRMIRQAHAGLYWSRDEGANATVQELIANGIVMVLPDRPWVHHLFEVPYPFRARSETEAKAMLDWILDHYAEAFEQLAPIRSWMAEHRSFGHFVGQFERLVEAVKAHPRPQPYRVFRNMALQAMSEEGVGWQTMRRLVTDYKNGGAPHRRARGAMYACYQAVRDLDDLQSGDVWLRPPATDAPVEPPASLARSATPAIA